MNLLFDFTVDKATATICITREFAADLDRVWDAWTKAELLDQWWAPKSWRVQTKEMGFKEGIRAGMANLEEFLRTLATHE